MWHPGLLALVCKTLPIVKPKGLEGFGLLAVQGGDVTEALECEPQTQSFPHCSCPPSHALEARCGKWSFSAGSACCSPAGCGTGIPSWRCCLCVPRLQGSVSLSQHLLLPWGLCDRFVAWHPRQARWPCGTPPRRRCSACMRGLV